ncbi:MAG: MBL fold metallo-hydrolase, partial [Pseudomonadota bacterium]
MNRTLGMGVGLLLGLMVCAASGAQNNFDDVVIEAQPLGSGVYMLTGRGGNLGLSTGEDATFLIDDQYAPLTDKIEAAIA